MSFSALNTIKTVVNHFATPANKTTEAEKLKAIRLNVNFITRYPEFFDDINLNVNTVASFPELFNGSNDVTESLFFGVSVGMRTLDLTSTYTVATLTAVEKAEVENCSPERAFNELALHWAGLLNEGNTVIPYVPFEGFKTVNGVISLRSRFGVIIPTV